MKQQSGFTISADERAERRSQLKKALRDKEYREAFVRQQIETHLPFQIKAMRRAEGWNQARLGEKLGKPQSVVSRLERPDYGRFNINTLIEIAAVFDVGLLVTFVPFNHLLDRASGFSASDVKVSSFSEDPVFNSSKTPGNVSMIDRSSLPEEFTDAPMSLAQGKTVGTRYIPADTTPSINYA